MKVFLVLVPVTILAGAALTVANAGTEAKRTICHRTSSTKNPYVKLAVSSRQLRAHLKHAADIVPAPRAGCPRSVLTASVGGQAFKITLTGEAETPAGDPVATGTATVRMRAGQGQVCYRLSVTNLTPAIAAHIHVGAAGTPGNVVVPLKTPIGGQSSGCTAAARGLVAAMLAKPANYYVNVHTKEFPAGAVRGQLVGSSASSLGKSFALTLKGTTEPNASGTAVIRIRGDDGLVCYRLHVENVTLPTVGAHIHKGAAGVSGPVVVPFVPPGADGNSSGCTQSQTALIDDIVANPAGYYVNVHTREHPGGAIRSQLG
jgi:CHRD domain-containing protein